MSWRTRTAVRLPLHDDTVVVRGGVLERSNALKAIRISEAKLGRAGISVWGIDGVDAAVLVEEVERRGLLPHTTIRLSTAGAVRRGGFDIVPTGQPPHQTITLPASYPEDDSIDRLIDLFDAPVPRVSLQGVDHSSRR